jgi:hypothetical protein
MKKLIIISAGLFLSLTLCAQTWKAPIYRITGKSTVKTLKLWPKTSLSIGTLTLDTDSLKENKYFNGTFIGGNADSLQIKLMNVRMNSVFKNGNKIQTTIPAKNYLIAPYDSTYQINIALTDIDFLSYQNRIKEKLFNCEDYVLFSALFVLLVSPFICYNYSDNTFNQDRYQYWALGSTIGIASGITLQMMGARGGLQFKAGWPEKKAKVWSFNRH